MATEFKLIIAVDDEVTEIYAAQAAQAAFAEIDRLEDELSRFRAMSDITRVNGLLAGQRIPVGMATADCLELAAAVRAETSGAFDISVGPLMSIYRNHDGTPRTPQSEELDAARDRIGQGIYEVEEGGFVVAKVDYPALDLGAVGKGYALDQAAALLQQWSVYRALLNAGDSTVLAMQAPAGDEGWPVSVGNEVKRIISLKERAVSGSGFQVQGAHIMNPRTLQPVPVKAERVWACAPTAALSDALSTAFAVMDIDEIEGFCSRHAEIEWIAA